MEAKKCFKLAAASLAGIIISLSATSSAEAAPGDLDVSFSDDGKVTTDFFGSGDGANSVVIQRNGKIVAAGTAFNNRNSTLDFALARYNRDGTLDHTFGSGGKVTTDLTGNSPIAFSETGAAVRLQRNGKLVLAGTVFDPNTSLNAFAVVRYSNHGDLDPTFGGVGYVVTSFETSARANDLAVQSDGKLVVAGTVDRIDTNEHDFVLARYNPDGSLDQSFGDGGIVVTNLTFADEANALRLTPEGKILVAGVSFCLGFPCTARDFILMRYNPDGSLDPSFGDGGKVTTDFRIRDGANALDVAPDGKIIVAGFADAECAGSCPVFAVARYNPNGSPDSGFGTGGKLTTPLGRIARATAVVIPTSLKNPKILVGGFYQESAVCGTPTQTFACDFALVRYNWDGSLDASFGTGGIVTTDFGGGSRDQAFDLAVQKNGRIILAGNNGLDFALARYLSDECLAPLSAPYSNNLPQGLDDEVNDLACKYSSGGWKEKTASIEPKVKEVRGMAQNLINGWRPR